MLMFTGTLPATEVLIIAGVVALLFVIRLMHGQRDRERINIHLESRGCTLIDARWRPFGPGWAGGRWDRIYEVHYEDESGNGHHAFCRTSGWSGVWFTEDQVTEPAVPASDEISLEEENRRLRDEVEQLKRKLS
jgi:hypothetical protein